MFFATFVNDRLRAESERSPPSSCPGQGKRFADWGKFHSARLGSSLQKTFVCNGLLETTDWQGFCRRIPVRSAPRNGLRRCVMKRFLLRLFFAVALTLAAAALVRPGQAQQAD